MLNEILIYQLDKLYLIDEYEKIDDNDEDEPELM